ncbi:MAG TPA: radical SAM protein, partial [Candidatus Eisenbacteria bacterium]|nr:radical SAM protein [Candidatus Eisenbacteria bacterium]
MSFAIQLRESLSPARLHLILMPTEACNFRCVYCYESFRLRRMEPGVVRGVKQLLSRRAPGLEWLQIGWFGGEPLLARDVMEDVLDHVGELRRRNPAMFFASDATTNAWNLTPAVLERLTERGLTRYQVAFDGPRAWHDRKRIRPGGLPTFDRVWGNLAACRGSAAAFRIMVRLHVSAENLGSVGLFLDEYQNEFGSDSRFELYIRGLSRLGGPNDAALPVLDGAEGRRIIEGLRREAAGRGIRLADLGPGAAVCYAARANSFLIRADGRVNKCTVALEHPNNQVG